MIFAVWTFLTALCTFAITAVLGKFLIPFLHKLNFGQTILEIGPSWHKEKQGTPTMGGIMFIVGIALVTTVSVLLYNIFGVQAVTVYQSDPTRCAVFVFTGLALALGHSAIGFIDDYIKVVKKRNLGLTALQKLVLQFAVTIAYLAGLGFLGYGGTTVIPFVGTVDLGWLYYPIAAIVIVGVVNAVNLTDGIDGLDGSLTFFASLFFMLIANLVGFMGVSFMSAAVAGGCLGFLVWNFHPAKVFMGDTGSLFLGGIVCALAFAVDMPILLLPLGIVYLCEMFSVMLQVSYFKLTHGKRLFKMSPIHHHFEMCGWSEVKIVSVFSFVTVIFGVAAFLLVYFGV
ncbi:MAG: phospho-N-acetylmuramoyl-pentapeptide-transferase [Ruminococcus sp.]|nr:phospho-N-acetylmuramoyl-pentapeptide-transferase [Ruminococcus sp.]